MSNEPLLSLINNAALLLTLALFYETIPMQQIKRSRWLEILTGIAIGSIGLAVMLSPWQFSEGVTFDTRSILLSLTGYFFGIIPTTIATAMTITLRLWQGGAGALTGSAVILTSAFLGLGWRYWRKPAKAIPPAGMNFTALASLSNWQCWPGCCLYQARLP